MSRLSYPLALALVLTGAPRAALAEPAQPPADQAARAALAQGDPPQETARQAASQARPADPHTTAAGDGQQTDTYVVVGADPARAARLAARARAWSAARGHAALDLAHEQAAPAASVTRRQLELLNEIERALLDARELSASLREAAALRVLEAAESRLLDALELPGAHAYLAEVNVQLGLCAAQLGDQGLAETALARAFSLDRTRRVEAAETPPATLALAQRIAARQAARAAGELQLEVTPESAQIWLDGAPQGAGTTLLRAPPGTHLLVVRAAGHAPYATLLQLEPGRRPAQRVALAPLPAELARRTLLAARDIADARAPATTLARAGGADIYLFEAAQGPLPRALVHRCTAAGCSLLEGVDATSAAQPRFSGANGASSWLTGPPGTRGRPDTVPVWRRWPLWTGIAVAVVSGVAAALVLTRDGSTEQQRELKIDPGSLPR